MKLEIELPGRAGEMVEELEAHDPLFREKLRNELRGSAMELISSNYQQLEQMRAQQLGGGEQAEEKREAVEEAVDQ